MIKEKVRNVSATFGLGRGRVLRGGANLFNWRPMRRKRGQVYYSASDVGVGSFFLP